MKAQCCQSTVHTPKQWTGNTEPSPLTWTTVPGSDGDTTSYNVTTLNNGSQYSFRVRAVNGASGSVKGAPSDPASATPLEPNTTPSFGNQTIADQTFIKDVEITADTLPEARGGTGTLTYSLAASDPNGSLPAGLTFTVSSRQLVGTPTTTQSAISYSYTATDADGDTAVLTFTIAVEEDTQPSFGSETVADQRYTQNVDITAVTLPASTTGNATLDYSLSPALPAGLNFDQASRVLNGKPSEVMSQTEYTYTVTDANGDTATLTFNITVVASKEPSATPTPIPSPAFISEIEPAFRGVSIYPGEPLRLRTRIFGLQGIENPSLGDDVDFSWQQIGGGVTRGLDGTGSSILYRAPSQLGTYRVTASLTRQDCTSLNPVVVECCRLHRRVRGQGCTSVGIGRAACAASQPAGADTVGGRR